MSRTKDSGAVLRGVIMDGRPRSLARRTSPQQPALEPERAAGGVAKGVTLAQAVPSREQELSAAFDEGFRAGLRQGEGDRQAVHDDLARAAREAGQHQGLEQGRLEGREAGRREIEREAQEARAAAVARLALLDRLLETLPDELARRVEAAGDEMVALCHGVVCRILGEQLVTPQGIAHAVRVAIAEVGRGELGGGQAPIAIHLHPRDLRLLEGDDQVARWTVRAGSASSPAARWVADERVTPGGCIVRTGEGSLDARLETQFAALRKLLLDGAGNAGSGAARPSEDAPPTAAATVQAPATGLPPGEVAQ